MKTIIWLILILLCVFIISFFKKNQSSAPVNVSPPKNVSTVVIEGGINTWREILGNDYVDSLEVLIKEQTGLFVDFRYYQDGHVGEIWTIGIHAPMRGELYQTLSVDWHTPEGAYVRLIENLPKRYLKQN